MKKLALFLILFSVGLFAQNPDKPKTLHTYTEQEITNAIYQVVLQGIRVVPVQGNDTLKVKADISGATINATITDVGIKGSSSLGNNTLTVGTTAVQVSSTSTACRWVSVMNNTPGAIIYVGGSSVSTSNGYAALGYKDAVRVEIDNLTKLYLISSQASTDVRYLYAN